MQRKPVAAVVSFGLTLASVLAGCAALSVDRSATQAAVEQANRAFEDVIRAGDSERIGSLYTPDAIAFPPDAPMVKGRDNVVGFQKVGAPQA